MHLIVKLTPCSLKFYTYKTKQGMCMHACSHDDLQTNQNPRTCVVVVFCYAEDLVLLVRVYLQVQEEDHHLHHVHVLVGQYLICGEPFGCEQRFCGRIMECGHGEWYEPAKWWRMQRRWLGQAWRLGLLLCFPCWCKSWNGRRWYKVRRIIYISLRWLV